MARKLLQQLFPGICRHEFGWPRKSPEGDYYQVCLICGDEYQYDWPTMQRLGKRVRDNNGPVPDERVVRKATWSPRARRLRMALPVKFHSQSGNELVEGIIDNLSQSGLFIHSQNAPAKGELLEMLFEMPVEISGQQNAEVLCAGQVVRVAGNSNEDGSRGFAVKVIDYRFLHNDARKRRRENNTQRSF